MMADMDWIRSLTADEIQKMTQEEYRMYRGALLRWAAQSVQGGVQPPLPLRPWVRLKDVRIWQW